MKKIHVFILFAVVAFLAASKPAFAQGNLQFNQVIHFDLAGAGTQSITVPAGKIWKIESVSMGAQGSMPSVYLRNSGGQNIAHLSSPANANSANYPYWLPAGFTGSFLNNYPSTRCSISIIEFNVVP